MSHTTYVTAAGPLVVQVGISRATINPLAPATKVPLDVIDGGAGTVSGVAKKNGLPTAGLRIHLLDRAQMRVVRRGTSGPGGTYSFTYLRPGPFIAVCSEHHDPEVDAQAHDMIEA